LFAQEYDYFYMLSPGGDTVSITEQHLTINHALAMASISDPVFKNR